MSPFLQRGHDEAAGSAWCVSYGGELPRGLDPGRCGVFGPQVLVVMRVQHARVKVANLLERPLVFRGRHRRDVVPTEQGEMMIAPQLVPQLLKRDRSDDISRIPEKRHHFTVGMDRPLVAS